MLNASVLDVSLRKSNVARGVVIILMDDNSAASGDNMLNASVLDISLKKSNVARGVVIILKDDKSAASGDNTT